MGVRSLLLLALLFCGGGVSYYYGKIWLYKWRSIQLDTMLLEHPVHSLGIIMDGNRRWALSHGYKPWIGHRQGVEPIKAVAKFCIEKHIQQVTLYAWSLENFKRSAEEQEFLFSILAQEIKSKEFTSLCEQGIRVRFIGDSARFPSQLRDMIQDIEVQTAAYDRLIMNILFCYGGQQEILAAVRRICVEQVADPQRQITAEQFEAALWSTGITEPNLIIRTGGCARLSNFLLYKSAYSELYFLDCYWPEVTERNLIDALSYYVACKRRFGS